MTTADQGARITQAFYDYLEDMLKKARLPKAIRDPETQQWMDNPERLELKAADLECIRKALLDNNLKLSSVQAGEFGKVVKAAAEQFPFDDDGSESREYALQ